MKTLIGIYRKQDYAIRPVLEAILMHHDFYRGEPMVKPPAVYLAAASALARTRHRHPELGIARSGQMGQQLFRPPNVSQLGRHRWLDASTMKKGRWMVVTYALEGHTADAWNDSYADEETVDEALNSALELWRWPALRAEQQNELAGLANRVEGLIVADWQRQPYLALRQNALRQLIAVPVHATAIAGNATTAAATTPARS